MADAMEDDLQILDSLKAFENYMEGLGDNLATEKQAEVKKYFHEILSQILIFFRYLCTDKMHGDTYRNSLFESIQGRVAVILTKQHRMIYSNTIIDSQLDAFLSMIMEFKAVDYHLIANQINIKIHRTYKLMITQCNVTNEGGGTIEIKLDMELNDKDVRFKDELEMIKHDYDYISQHQDVFQDLDVLMMQEILLRQRGLEQVHRSIAYSLRLHIDRIDYRIGKILPAGDYYLKYNIRSSLISPQNFILFKPEVTLSMLRAFQMKKDISKLSNDVLYKTLQDHFLSTADDLSFFWKTIDRYMKIQ